MLEKIKYMAELFPYCLTIVDVMDSGRPCLYANEKFFLNTGYTPNFALGRNLSFLQGKLTDQTTCAFMRQSMRYSKACIQDIINYKEDGTPFLNRLLLLPLKTKGKVFYIGIQNDLTQQKRLLHHNVKLKNVSDCEIKHYVNNPLTIALNGHSQILDSNSSDEIIERARTNLFESLIRINDFALNVEKISEFENYKYL